MPKRLGPMPKRLDPMPKRLQTDRKVDTEQTFSSAWSAGRCCDRSAQWVVPSSWWALLWQTRWTGVWQIADVRLKGTTTKFCLGDGFIGTEAHPPQNLVSPPISAALFRKCCKLQKCHMRQEKGYWNIIISGRRPPMIFRLRGTRPPQSKNAHGVNVKIWHSRGHGAPSSFRHLLEYLVYTETNFCTITTNP